MRNHKPSLVALHDRQQTDTMICKLKVIMFIHSGDTTMTCHKHSLGSTT